MIRTTLGIDLGGCMSGNSAYALISWEGDEAKVIELVKEPKHIDHLSCAVFFQKYAFKA